MPYTFEQCMQVPAKDIQVGQWMAIPIQLSPPLNAYDAVCIQGPISEEGQDVVFSVTFTHCLREDIRFTSRQQAYQVNFDPVTHQIASLKMDFIRKSDELVFILKPEFAPKPEEL